MKKDQIKHVAMTLLVASVLSFSACHKQVASAPVPAPPPSATRPLRGGATNSSASDPSGGKTNSGDSDAEPE